MRVGKGWDWEGGVNSAGYVGGRGWVEVEMG